MLVVLIKLLICSFALFPVIFLFIRLLRNTLNFSQLVFPLRFFEIGTFFTPNVFNLSQAKLAPSKNVSFPIFISRSITDSLNNLELFDSSSFIISYGFFISLDLLNLHIHNIYNFLKVEDDYVLAKFQIFHLVSLQSNHI